MSAVCPSGRYGQLAATQALRACGATVQNGGKGGRGGAGACGKGLAPGRAARQAGPPPGGVQARLATAAPARRRYEWARRRYEWARRRYEWARRRYEWARRTSGTMSAQRRRWRNSGRCRNRGQAARRPSVWRALRSARDGARRGAKMGTAMGEACKSQGRTPQGRTPPSQNHLPGSDQGRNVQSQRRRLAKGPNRMTTPRTAQKNPWAEALPNRGRGSGSGETKQRMSRQRGRRRRALALPWPLGRSWRLRLGGWAGLRFLTVERRQRCRGGSLALALLRLGAGRKTRRRGGPVTRGCSGLPQRAFGPAPVGAAECRWAGGGAGGRLWCRGMAAAGRGSGAAQAQHRTRGGQRPAREGGGHQHALLWWGRAEREAFCWGDNPAGSGAPKKQQRRLRACFSSLGPEDRLRFLWMGGRGKPA